MPDEKKQKKLKRLITLEQDIVEELEDIDSKIEEVNQKVDSIDISGKADKDEVQSALDELNTKVENVKTIKGDKGDDGKDYVLTPEDKKEIASSIKVPVVEKIIVEKTEVVKEQPIVKTEIVKETVNTVIEDLSGKIIVERINELPTNDQALKIDAKHIKNLPSAIQQYGGVTPQKVADMIAENPSGASAFTDLTDTPSSYTSQGTKIVRVKADETGLEFVTPSSEADTLQTVTDRGATTTNELTTPGIKAQSSAGLTLKSNSGSTIALFGAGGGNNATFYDGVKLDSQTADRILGTDASKNITALDTATYPSLTELSYVKGVTSAIQTQIDGKVPTSRTLTINGTAYDLSADRSWTVSATPGGSDTQVQFNDGGSFGGDSGLVFNKTDDILTVGARLRTGNGTALLPALSSSADTNTGIYWSGADDLIFSTNGTARVSINNVGTTVFIPNGTQTLSISSTGLGIGGLYSGFSGQFNVQNISSAAVSKVTAVIKAQTSQTGDLTQWQNTSGTVIGSVSVSGEVLIGGGTQNYVWGKRAGTLLTLQSQSAGTVSQVEYYSKDGDGTDDVGFAVFAKGIPSNITNFEQLRFFYNNAITSYVIGSNKGGTGAYRNFRFGNGLQPTDLVIGATTGNIGINTTTPAVRTHILDTSTQLRMGYDASNYYDTTVGSTGAVTFNAVGSGARFSFSDDVGIDTVGKGLYIKEGSNATMGTATLVGGTVVVNTTKVTANSRIFLTVNGGTLTNVGAVYISARTAGTSFTISSLNILDTSDVAWMIVEPS